MNKDNKHNLSPDELFKLLDQKPVDTAHLDDFEKEALEGFAMLDSSEQAEESYRHVLKELSKKNSGQPEEQRKRPVLWFSAAAALLLILGLGIVWLQSNKDISGDNIAMNEPSPVSQPMPAPADESAATEKAVTGKENTIATTNSVPGVTQVMPDFKAALKPAENRQETDDVLRENEVTRAKQPKQAATGEAAPLGPEAGKPVILGYNKEQDGLVFKDQDEANKSVEKSKGKADKFAADEEKPAAADNTASFEVAGDLAYSDKGKAANNVDTKSTAKKKEEKEAGNAPVTATASNGTPYKNAAVVVPGSSSDADLYMGGEKALYAYILKQAKEKSPTQILKGRYTLKGEVSTGGILNVISITNTSKDCSDCATLLKSIIDKMGGWQNSHNSGKTPLKISLELTF